MNPRDALNFLRSPTGAFLGFTVILGAAFLIAKGFSDQKQEAPRAKETPASPPKKNVPEQLLQTVQRVIVPFNAASTNKETQKPASSPVPVPKEEKKPSFTPISLYPDTPLNEPKPLGKFYAPYGRLIPCELIVTIDSSSIQTPIIGLVAEDIYHNGRLVIPAGTEVHGTAQTDHKRERIASNGDWTLVWQGGEELKLTGIALDREKDFNGDGWGITDGSAGLRGRVLKSDNMAEIKLFAATFLSGAASALTEKESTFLGSQLSPTLKNAPLKGAQDVLSVYAKQILDTIQRDGFYVRVPAGKEFYLYVRQTIDKSDAVLGGTRIPSVDTNETTRASLRAQAQEP